MDEESYFFRLSKWEKPLLDYYKNNPDFISPISRKNEVISFVEGGLKDLSISRKSFSWGIQVPGNNDHVIYVWLDALTNYLSALNYPDTNDPLFKKFWPASVHLIGKDILRFHAVYWPAFLLAAKIPLPKKIYSHGWILSGNEKMSKSKGNILDPIEIINQYGLDPLRYYLIKEVSFGNDGNISKERLEDCINSDLANNFGNLCQRVTAFTIKNCQGKIPDKIKFENDDLKILDKFKSNIDFIREKIDNQDINYYINFIVNSLFKTLSLSRKSIASRFLSTKYHLLSFDQYIFRTSYLLESILELCNPVRIEISCSSEGPPKTTANVSVIFYGW